MISLAQSGDLSVRLRGTLGAAALNVSFTAPAGSVTALIGASGTGKTTILRALAGLQRLDGEVRVGKVIWQDHARFTPPFRRAVGFVFQHSLLFPHLSVRGNLDYAAKRAHSDRARFDEVVALLRLEPLLSRAPARLSGGERQRTALGRALLTAPKLLLLDEPLTGLDSDIKNALLPELKAVLTALDIPVLYVSHDAGEVAQLADHKLGLQNGVVTAGSMLHPHTDESLLIDLTQEQIVRLAAAALRAGLS